MIEAIKAIWSSLKWFFGILSGFLASFWALLTGLVATVVAIWTTISNGMEVVVGYLAAAWAALGASKAGVDSLVAAGVPSPIVTGAAYASNYIPIQLMLATSGGLLVTYITAVFVRIVKSWLPSVN